MTRHLGLRLTAHCLSLSLPKSHPQVFMASTHSISFLLASFGLYLGLSLDTVETASDERTAFFGKLSKGYDSQSHSQREEILFFLKPIESKLASFARSKRDTETCQAGPVTTSNMQDPLFIIQYDSLEQFDACLSNEVLEANLAPLLDQPLPDDYLAVIIRKLEEIYPDGIPDDQLKRLSYLSRFYRPEEISKWRVTSNDTLVALLNPDNGAWKPDQLKQLVLTYLKLGGNLTGPLLSVLGGGNLCLLEADQLWPISPESIGQAEKLDVSSCAQSKKDILYEKASSAFASQEGTSAYYLLIQPYLGGAPVEDLQKLARSQVAMDISTFTNLKPEELKELSVQDVKDLLGVHLPDLKDAESHPSVSAWIKSHFQSELDTLGIGLQGGMMAPSTSSSPAVGETTAEGPSVAVSMAIPTVDSTATPDADATFPSVPIDVTDFSPTLLLEVILATNEASSPLEATHATTVGLPPDAAVPTSSVSASSEGRDTGSPVPATVTDTSMTSTEATAASHRIPANVTVLGATRGTNTMTSVTTTTVSSNGTADGAVLPTLAPHSSATTSLSAVAASTRVTTDWTILPTVATHIDGTTSVSTAAAPMNITTSGIVLRTIDEARAPNETISPAPTPSINHTPSTPNTSLATSSEQPSTPPGPLPNTTTSASLGGAPATSEKTPAVSRTTPAPGIETPHETAVSPGLGLPRTTVAATPERGTTSRAAPKTKPPTYPTPNGYINVKPLSASAASHPLSCLLLTPSLVVGLSVLRWLF